MSESGTAPAPANDSAAGGDEGPGRIWQVRELQLAAVAAVLLAAAWVIDLVAGGPALLIGGVELVAAVVAASTFVPDALRNLRHGRIGVG